MDRRMRGSKIVDLLHPVGAHHDKGKLLGLRFVNQESFHHYACLVRTYFERCGKPVASPVQTRHLA